MKIFVKDRESKRPFDKKLIFEGKRITLQLSDNIEYELYEAKDLHQSRREDDKGLVVMATGDMKYLIVRPDVTNVIIIDVEN